MDSVPGVTQWRRRLIRIALCGWLLLLVPLASAGCESVGQQEWKPSPWYDTDTPIQLSSLLKPYLLYEGEGDESGVPPEAFAKAVLVGPGNEARILPRSTSFKGLVRIDTGDQALEFARLFTSETTNYLFEDSKYEEVFLAKGSEPSFDELSARDWKKYRVRTPAVRHQESGFVIQRFVVNDEGTELYRLTECVGRDGAYSVSRVEPIAKGLSVLVMGYW